MFTIKVDFKNEQPDKLVDYAKNLDSNKYNQIWCVFDIDDTYTEGHLEYAINTAKKHNINLAYSNESFEVWLLCHLTSTVGVNLTRKTYIKEINKFLESKGFKNYEKNDAELIKKVFIPYVLEAVKNAKKTYQNREAENQRCFLGNKNYPIWEWKSTTTVYQLIEVLQLTDK